MKKSQLAELVREELRGYSKYIGKTKGGTSDEFMRILTKIAKGEDEKYERRPDTDPLPHEKLHSYSSETTPEGEHEVWAIYFDPKTDTYNKRHRVPEETIFGKNAKIQRGDIGEREDEKYEGDPEKGNAILDKANPDNVDRITRGEDPIYEEASNIESVEISYAYPGNRLYSIRINGAKVFEKEQAIQTIKDLTGLEVPQRAYFDDPEVLAIVDALKAKGIQADSSEMDIS